VSDLQRSLESIDRPRIRRPPSAPSNVVPVSDPDAAIRGAGRYQFLDVWVDRFTIDDFLHYVRCVTTARRPTVIAHHNLNSLAICRRSPVIRSFYDQVDAVFVDGMGVVATARLVGAPIRAEHRLAVLDWIWPLLEMAARERWHVMHLGGSEDVLDEATRSILSRHPSLRLTCIDGYFDMDPGSTDGADALARVQAARPDLLLVGMGMPRQELWLLENRHSLPPCVVITVGGIFSFISGERRAAPRWLGPLGLEWLFRLVTEPRRLWRRYLLEPLPLVMPIAGSVLRRSSSIVRRDGWGLRGRGGRDAPVDIRDHGEGPGDAAGPT
jgi:N-acetylglucosaminyldiphosphoundecaprenol N-acetyl-beta-D-mannosaminyltransferase